MMDALGDTCKTNLKIGPILIHEWTDLMAYTPDEKEVC